MTTKSCFVVMAIGDQTVGDDVVTAADLRKRYDDLIKEALLKADPTLDVIRADDVAAPGTISSDILTRLMHSDIVVADVSYPNPNVFYELGLRHSCRTGTIIIRDQDAGRAPFDIAHLRHIQYENSASGLKQLATDFESALGFLDKNPDSPDNHLLELAKLTKYEFPDYSDPIVEEDPETKAIMAVMETPEVLDMLVRQASGEEIQQSDLMSAMLKNPNVAGLMTKALINSGDLSLSPPSKPQPHIGGQRKPRKNKGKNKGKRKR